MSLPVAVSPEPMTQRDCYSEVEDDQGILKGEGVEAGLTVSV